MPLPSPKKEQNKDSFVSSCMGNDTMRSEFPKESQRYAVCQSKYRQSKRSKGSVRWDDEEVDSVDYIIY